MLLLIMLQPNRAELKQPMLGVVTAQLQVQQSYAHPGTYALHDARAVQALQQMQGLCAASLVCWPAVLSGCVPLSLEQTCCAAAGKLDCHEGVGG
jgi:hypothetical protein